MDDNEDCIGESHYTNSIYVGSECNVHNVAEKEEMVRALEIQIRMFRQGKGDHVSLSKPEEDIMLVSLL